MSALGGAVGLCIYKSSSKYFTLDQMMMCTVFISEVPIMTKIEKQLRWLDRWCSKYRQVPQTVL